MTFKLATRFHDDYRMIDPLGSCRLDIPVHIPWAAVDELEPEAIVVLGRTAMAESGPVSTALTLDR